MPFADAFDLGDAELAIYSALKLEVYRRLTAASRSAQPWITANRLAQLFSRPPADGRGLDPAPDLFHASSYFFRERLRGLNHGTFLRGDGARRRRSLAYAWNEAVTPAQLQHFGQLQGMLGRDVHLARDVQAIHDAFGNGPFTTREYLRCFQARHRRVVGGAAGHRFHEFLMRRLDKLQRKGLVIPDGNALRLGPDSHTVLHLLDLFIFRAEPETP